MRDSMSLLDARGVVDLHGSMFLAVGVSGAGRQPGGLGLALRGFLRHAASSAEDVGWKRKESFQASGQQCLYDGEMQTAGALCCQGCLLQAEMHGEPPRSLSFSGRQSHVPSRLGLR